MPFSIVLYESDIRLMKPELREALLKWYFERNSDTPRSEPSDLEVIPPDPPATTEDGNRRVAFPEFVKAGLISPGDEIRCRALKRQKRQGAEDYIRGARMSADGSVEFQGKRFFKPSKLALAMVNSNGAEKPAEALNGYVYLFVQTGNSLVSLDDIRRKLLFEASPGQVASDSLPFADSALTTEVLQKAATLAKEHSTPTRPVTSRQVLKAARAFAKACSAPGNPMTLEEAFEKLYGGPRPAQGSE